jgi:hypothetical protein
MVEGWRSAAPAGLIVAIAAHCSGRGGTASGGSCCHCRNTAEVHNRAVIDHAPPRRPGRGGSWLAQGPLSCCWRPGHPRLRTCPPAARSSGAQLLGALTPATQCSSLCRLRLRPHAMPCATSVNMQRHSRSFRLTSVASRRPTHSPDPALRPYQHLLPGAMVIQISCGSGLLLQGWCRHLPQQLRAAAFHSCSKPCAAV